MHRPFTFTSESVAAGHPDKICDQISDALVDAVFERTPDPHQTRAAIETLATTNHLVIAGEISKATDLPKEEIERIAREVVRDLGYTDPDIHFHADHLTVDVRVHAQSEEIAAGVDDGGAGDQGLMFGYARRDNEALMPMPVWAAHRLIERIDRLRETKGIEALRPDGKSQVSIRYEDGKPVAIEKVVIGVPHHPDLSRETLKRELWEKALEPLVKEWNLPYAPDLGGETNYIVNGTGVWNVGGPHSDTGLTGRKIIVDTYGGWGRHGGGAFSGKDPTKVDRSAAYMLRHIAKHVVANGMADECELQVAYAIGVREPMSLLVDTRGTGDDRAIEDHVRRTFDLTPGGIIEHLALRRAIYRNTAAYGHFGRAGMPWEETAAVSED